MPNRADQLKPNFVLGGYLPRTLDESAVLAPDPQAWMGEALRVSMNAVGWSAPNPAVGCVLVKNGQKVAEGFTQAYRHEHAEKMLFQQISPMTRDWSDAELYVTLEPCSHYGHQPPCLDLILNSTIKTIHVACVDPDDRVSGKSIEKMTLAGKRVILGSFENECRAWHLPFFYSRKNSTPLWAAKWAQTKEGDLADALGNSKWISGKKSRAYTHWLRQKYDAILVGAGTWIQDQPLLTVRDCAPPHRRNPLRIVFDPKGRLLEEGVNLPCSVEWPLLIFSRADGVAQFSGRVRPGLTVESLDHGSEGNSNASVEGLVRKLVERVNALPLQSVMVEGGPTLLGALFALNVFQVCHQFVGCREFDLRSQNFKLKNFTGNDYLKVVHQKIDEDVLHEWIKWS